MSWASMMLFMATMSAWVSRMSSQVAKFTASSSAMDFLSSAACTRHGLHGGHRIAADLLQLAVGLAQVRLFGGEDGICGPPRAEVAQAEGRPRRSPPYGKRARRRSVALP